MGATLSRACAFAVPFRSEVRAARAAECSEASRSFACSFFRKKCVRSTAARSTEVWYTFLPQSAAFRRWLTGCAHLLLWVGSKSGPVQYSRGFVSSQMVCHFGFLFHSLALLVSVVLLHNTYIHIEVSTYVSTCPSTLYRIGLCPCFTLDALGCFCTTRVAESPPRLVKPTQTNPETSNKKRWACLRSPLSPSDWIDRCLFLYRRVCSPGKGPAVSTASLTPPT